ncbi:MAG: alpha/beta fold hydrolase [Acetivibrionales bacterium]|jgi:pimeloyl-ACP methyl ester carboxylesterase
MRGLLYIISFLIIILLSSYLYIFICNIRSVKWFKEPSAEGKFADSNGKKIYYRVKGKGGPIVVVINNIGSSQAEWWHIQNELGQKCRIITMDRPGYGWSTAENDDTSAYSFVDELNIILKFEKVKKPVFIVAKGTGVIYAGYYCIKHPSKVLGAIFINPLPLNYKAWSQAIQSIDECPGMIESAKKMQYKASKGLFQIMTPFRGYRLDKRYRRHIIEHYSKTENYDIMQNEISQLESVLDEMESWDKFPKIPLRILYPAGEALIRDWIRSGINEYSARQLGRRYQELSKDIMSISPHSTSLEVEGAGEHIHLGKPDIIISEIKALISEQKTAT